MSSVPTVHITDWLGIRIAGTTSVKALVQMIESKAAETWPTQRVACGIIRRRPGDDPRPDIDDSFQIAQIYRWKKIVDRVENGATEIALSEVPSAIRVNRKVGDPWYEVITHVLIPERSGSRR